MTRFLSFVLLGGFFSGLLGAQTPSIAGCTIFPANNIWNTPINNLPVHPNSAAWVQTIGVDSPVHPDFGSTGGIPYNVVSGSQTAVNVTFEYADVSDAGPYPIPANPVIENGSDRHLLIVDTGNCTDYEIFNAVRRTDGSWWGGLGAIFPLGSNQLRPAGWASADVAGLSILAGLIRYDEVAAGSINHAIRFTAPVTGDTYLWPARNANSSYSGSQYPPMGSRFRLKAGFDVSSYPAADQVILNAMKKYGIILADKGSSWFIGGAPDPRWNDDVLHLLTYVTGANLEAVDESSLMVNRDSGQAQSSGSTGSGVITNQWVNLVNQNSGKCLEITGSGEGATADQRTCSTAATQRFMLTSVSGGYKITVQSSNMQLDVKGGPSATADGTPVIQWPYWGGSNEIWTLGSAAASGFYNFRPLSSGKCLDVSGASIYDGAPVFQWSCWGGTNQAWQLKP